LKDKNVKEDEEDEKKKKRNLRNVVIFTGRALQEITRDMTM